MKKKIIEQDALYSEAKQLAKKYRNLNTAKMQEALNIDYPKASKFLDMLREEGIVNAERIPNKANLNKLYKDKDWKEFENKPVIPLGAETATHNLVGNLMNDFNLIITGQAGSGKSTFFHCAMANLLKNTKASELQFVLIDSEKNEFSLYESLPNLALPVVKTPKEAKTAFEWCLKEIEARSKLLKGKNAPMTIEDYNTKHENKIPRIVIIIDECSDLMVDDLDFFKKAILEILKFSHSTSVNILMATSKLSQTKIYPKELIDAFGFRIAFKTTTSADSEAIFGVPGAEDLQGKGDMLLMYPYDQELTRLQGFYISEK